MTDGCSEHPRCPSACALSTHRSSTRTKWPRPLLSGTREAPANQRSEGNHSVACTAKDVLNTKQVPLSARRTTTVVHLIDTQLSLAIYLLGCGSRTPRDIKIHRCSSPSHKMAETKQKTKQRNRHKQRTHTAICSVGKERQLYLSYTKLVLQFYSC